MMKPMARNLLASAGSDAGNRLLGFFATAYLARVMGPQSFGLISVGISVLSYCILFAGPGLNVLATRTVAATPGPMLEFSRDVLGVRTMLAAAWAMIATLATFAFYGYSSAWATIAVFGFTAVPLALAPDWYVQGKGGMVALAVARFLMSVTYLLMLVVLVHGPGDTVWTAVAFCAGNCVMAAALGVTFNRMAGPFRLRVNLRRLWELLQESYPLGLSTFLTQTVMNLPVLIVAAVLSSKETGLFGAAMKLVFFALMIDRVFYLLFLPVASRAYVAGPDRMRHVTVLGLKMVLLVALPVGLAGVFNADWVVTIVFGAGFSNAAEAFKWMMPYFVTTVVSTVMMTVLFATQRERDFLKVLVPGTIAVVVFCAILTYQMGIAGSAAGLSAGEFVMTVMLIRQVITKQTIPLAATILPFVGSAILMGITLSLLSAMHPVLSSLVGSMVFAGSSILFRGFTREDVQVLRERIA